MSDRDIETPERDIDSSSENVLEDWQDDTAPAEDGRRDAGQGGGRRGIFGMQRRRVERRPAGVSLGGVVGVLITVADRRDRSPTVVVKFRIPVADVVIGDTHIK